MVDLPRHFVEIQHHLNKMHKPFGEYCALISLVLPIDGECGQGFPAQLFISAPEGTSHTKVLVHFTMKQGGTKKFRTLDGNS